MAHPNLSDVSIDSLLAELQRRLAKLHGLTAAQREVLNKHISHLRKLAAQTPDAGMVAKGLKKGTAPVGAKAIASRKGDKGAQTAEQLILALVQGKGAATAEINQAWKGTGRTGRADNTLNKMLKAGLLRREKLGGQKGCRYTPA